MVDLSKHLAKARQSIDKRNYDYAIEVCEECQELDPANLEVYQVLLDAAKRRAKETGGKTGLFGSISRIGLPAMSKDPQKQLSAAIKSMAKTPDAKSFATAGDAALKLAQGGTKALAPIAILFYEEVRATGLFNADVLFNLGHLYYERFKDSKESEALDKALKVMGELDRAKPDHATAGKLMRDWEAARSMQSRVQRQQGATGQDFRSQVASNESARKNEVMNRMIRTAEDAREVLGFIEGDLKTNPGDKQLWVKKGDIHRRFAQFAEARAAFEAAQRIDAHDFVVTMRLGDVRIEEAKAKVQAAEQSGQDATAAKQALLQVEIEEYRRRVERQPTETEHRYNLALRYLSAGQVDQAAGELQRTVQDPKRKKSSHRYLGFCFTKKGLFDLAIQQYDSYLKLVEDEHGDEAKDVRYARGRLHEQLNHRELAIADYTRLVEIDLGFRDAAERLNKLQGGG